MILIGEVNDNQFLALIRSIRRATILSVWKQATF